MPYEPYDNTLSSIATENNPGQPGGACAGPRSSGNSSAPAFIARHTGNPQLHQPKTAGSFVFGASYVYLMEIRVFLSLRSTTPQLPLGSPSLLNRLGNQLRSFS